MKLTFRIWLLIACIILAILIIAPWGYFEKGLLIKSVEQNSTAFEEGLRQGMVLKSVNSQAVNSLEDYTRVISSIFPSEGKVKLTLSTDKAEFILLTDNAPDLTLSPIPKTRIKTGLDLSGGARALVKPEKPLSQSEMNDLIAVTSNRINVFGISDVTVRSVSDLSGNNFMLVEVAGASPSDLKDLVAKQGKFEAKIGNETVFIGGDKDITYVARSGSEAGLEGCFPQDSGYYCKFRFGIYLSEEAAQRHADITGKLGVNISTGGRYLDKKLDLYLDNKQVDSLFISEDLKGRVTTQIAVSGSGSGPDYDSARDDALNQMNKLQTVLITGSLPYKLEIVKLDSISPVLGKEFSKNIILLGIVAFIGVSIVIFIKYRKIKITLAVILTMFSEALLTLGIAALIKWNLDAASIAGIIAGMGTGVDDQIVIIDESVSGKETSLKERIKAAFFIILSAFFVTIAAMLPLFWAGAGMLKGFALTTILGISVGILVTRPAFADILKRIEG